MMPNPALESPLLPLLLVACFIVLEWLQRRKATLLALDAFPRPARWAVYTGVLWLTLYFNPARTTPFIYFQF